MTLGDLYTTTSESSRLTPPRPLPLPLGEARGPASPPAVTTEDIGVCDCCRALSLWNEAVRINPCNLGGTYTKQGL